ncbi:RWD-domain-containing protein [Dentipellis sp. KUC8613]|nr:RWD-domain-containing protein [Dentipellis sp. KUC8613]
MSSDVLLEEFEVLESIYSDEFTKLSERDIKIYVEPEDPPDDGDTLKLELTVQYPDEYPDALPSMELEAIEGELEDNEASGLLDGMRVVGEENLGMAMTFTIVSHLREQLSDLIRAREEHRKQEAMEKEKKALEAEEARTRGTPVTPESFLAWKVKFDKETALRKQREEEEKLKALTPKEREEYKKSNLRLSGRQLFERDKDLEDDALVEEGTVSVDVSQYERTRADEDEDEEDRIHFSDSD